MLLPCVFGVYNGTISATTAREALKTTADEARAAAAAVAVLVTDAARQEDRIILHLALDVIRLVKNFSELNK